MAIDLWGLGLQAVNVAVLVWLLTRVFWRPVAAAIAARQAAASALIGDAEAGKSKADAAMAEVTALRDGISDEKAAVLAAAATQADAAAKTVLADAQAAADTLRDAAKRARAHTADALRADAATQSSQLAVDIARKLLGRVVSGDVQAAFLDLLVAAIEALPASDKTALVNNTGGVELASPGDLPPADKAHITKAIRAALGGAPEVTYITDPTLIAGYELRTAHFTLHNSWQADLSDILKGLEHAA